MGMPSYKIAFEGENAADDLYEHMVRLEIEEDIGKAASFMLRVSIALQEDGEWSYLKDDRFSLFNRVTVSIGSGEGEANPIFEGYITHLAPHFDPEEELCYLELRGLDPSCLMNLEERLVTWADQSHSDIASEIFNSYGITPEVEDAPVTHAEDGNVLVQRSTDIRFLKELAAKNGFDCYVSVDDSGEVKGFFKPYALDSSPLPPLAVHFEGETNVQFIDIQVSGNQPLSVAGRHVNLEDKSIEQVEMTEYDQELLGEESLIDIAQGKINELSAPAEAASRVYRGDVVSLDPSELESSLKGAQNRNGWFIRAKAIVNGESYGTAISSRRLIPVKGMGTRYSGNYFVSSVKHVIAGGNYEQHVELIRNAWGVAGNESFEGGS